MIHISAYRYNTLEMHAFTKDVKFYYISITSFIIFNMVHWWWWWWLMFYGHFCAHGRLKRPSDSQRLWIEVRVNSLRYAYAKIRIRVVVICGPAQYQLDHGGAPSSFHKTDKASFQLVHNLINLFAINECPYLQHIIILLFHFYKEKN